ncbi:complex I 24 kDa subunit family protein [Clostridium butyricum]|uniref:NADH-quinone oxidoreductase subunit NuoE family protein n=1 Tax=Clostridium butyricum TaxID=1492 RepID=UPI0013D5D3C8|nr:NAD(P)H-dependent oxidoreductase subunit E [Clostridium butyricum]MCQ2017732.1 NAD(P)H-dependent oxidoreductase subunit E [Clostridium butyricum]MCQ2021509.1 NAD(P)H-dependent oxidoreductase subunit E [Clostridium butyricum]NFB72600.1 NAD(P)H-dependent oxidoreductase subunit E [Clostridium butyricum]NFB92137.1 NAD(P)H-dependent oxidoreductase subunit E [Clostridium butyricum]UTY53069.1 NAD(P)H-dependent oxidoreductase subunit E [Clostridium butyricum]
MDKIDSILEKYDYNRQLLIAIMQDVQKEYHYLPEEILSYIAEKLKISEAKIYGVATFYENFSLKPKGKYVIKICNGTACHVRKSIPILEEFRNILGLCEEKSTTDDMMFAVETVSCLGACGLAPVCTVNDEVYPNMTKAKVKLLVDDIKKDFKAKILTSKEDTSYED